MTPSIDRLSSLPDDLICRILSFLQTKESAQTSILAKKYRFLWADVPTLYFHDQFYSYYCETGILYMVSRAMLLTKALSINTFHISSCVDNDSIKFELEKWITTVVERNVQTLFLDFWNSNYIEECVVPLCLFSCKTLVDLTLRWCTFPSFSSDSITLPSLKSLELYCIDYVVDDALPCLLSCCPVLDNLSIGGLVLVNFYNISSHSIKRLLIDLSSDLYGLDVPFYKLKIYAPALQYLKVMGYFSSLDISCHIPTLLTKACIYYINEDGDFILKMISFLESLRNVRCLKLYNGPVFSNGVKLTARFNNLTQLKFTGDWLFLMNLLESAENLEVLIINEVCEEDEEDGEKWMEPKQVPTCVLSRLRTLRLKRYWRGERTVGYLLRNARVLERIEIYSKHGRFDSEAKHKALKRISMFERGSVACKVAFC